MTDLQLPEWRKKYPDHREGIRGQDQYHLLLDDDETHQQFVCVLLERLFAMTLMGGKAPHADEFRQRMYHPVKGDWAFEWTAIIKRASNTERRLATGLLIEIRHEWSTPNASWLQYMAEEPEYAIEDNAQVDEAWYLQYGPGSKDVCRWTNCSFYAIPTEFGQWMT